MLNESYYKRPSGLIVPTIRSYEDAMRLVTAVPGLEGMTRVLQPVVIVDDLSSIGQTAKNSVQNNSQTAVTINSGNITTVNNFPATPAAGRGFFCHYYQDEGAAGAASYSYLLTCPPGQTIEWHSLWFSSSMNAAGLDSFRVAVNPLAALTTGKGAGNLNYVADTYVTATTTKAMLVKSPLYGSAAANTPFALTSNLDNPDGAVASAATATPVREFFAPIVLYPGGQMQITHTADGAHTFTAMRHAGVFEVKYF